MDISFVMRKLQRYVAGFTILALLSTFVTSVAFAQTFSDVDSGDWEYEYVENLAGQGVVSGYENGDFGPDDTLTRAQLAKMAVLAFVGEVNSSHDAGFTDLRGDWSDDYINTAAQNGLVEGYSDADGNPTGEFGPSDTVNRAAAAQMLVNAASLSTDEDSEPFTDVDSGDWYYGAMKTAYWYRMLDGYSDGTARPGAAVTRGQAAKMIVLAQEGEVRDPESVEVPTPTLPGELTVRLSSTTPAATTIPQNSFEVAYTVLTLDASNSDSDVSVSGLTITRSGLGAPGNFTAVKLYKGDVQVGTERTVSTTTNQSVFTFSSNPVVVPAGAMVNLEVRGDMGSVQNVSNALGVTSAADVVANATVGGSFPVVGNAMTTNNSTVGALEYEVVNTTGQLEVGDTNEIVGRLNLDATNQEDVTVRRILIEQTGSADTDDLANLTLKMGSSVVCDTDTWQGDYLVADCTGETGGGLHIEKGDDIALVLYADVVGGIGNTVAFDIDEATHVVAYGDVLGFRASVSEGANSATPTARSIVGGALTLSTSADNPSAQQIGIGADDVEMMRFNATTGGDAILIQDFDLTLDTANAVASEMTNIRIWSTDEDGNPLSVVAGPVDGSEGDTQETVDFADDWEIPAQETSEYVVTADIASTTAAADTFQLTIDVSGISAEYVSNGNAVASTDITTADVAGNVMTVAAPTLTINTATSPGDSTQVVNSQDVHVVGFTLSANTVDDLTISSVTVDQNSSGGDTVNDDVSNIRIYLDDNGTLTRLTNGQEISSAMATFSDISLTVPAGTTKKILLVADIPSSADNTDVFSLGFEDVDTTVATNYNFTVEDSESRTGDIVITNTDGNAAGTAAADVEVTIASAGTLTATLDNDSPSSHIIRTASLMNLATVIEWEADDEAWEVNQFQLKVDDQDNAQEVESITVVYTDEIGTEKTETVPLNLSGTANFDLATGSGVWVPKNDTALMYVYMNTASEDDGAVSGTTTSIDLDYDTNFEATSQGSNTQDTTLDAGADVEGNNHTIYAADLLVAVASDTPTSANVSEGQDQDVFKFNLTGSGENTATVLAVAVSVTGTATLQANATGDATLLNDSGDTVATEAYVTADSEGDTADANTIAVAVADAYGIPMGATVIINDGGTYYTRVIATLPSSGELTFTPAITSYDDATADDLIYSPMQPGSGKVYFGAASPMGANIADTGTTYTTAANGTLGFALNDTITVRGASTTDNEVIVCTSTISAITSSTSITGSAADCTGNETIDFDYTITGPGSDDVVLTAVIYGSGANDYINEEVTGEETFTVRGDVTGASPSSTGTRTIQLKINSGADIAWHDEWVDTGDDLDDADQNTSFIIESSLLNKEKDGYTVAPWSGSSLSFQT